MAAVETPVAPTAIQRLSKAKAEVAGKSTKPRPKSYSMADAEAAPPKVMVYGPSGSGKTFLIVGMLLNNETVFVVSSDFGSNGLVTVKNELNRIGRGKLLKNLHAIDLDNYDDIEQFFMAPTDFVANFYDMSITVLVWEGYSSFQCDILDEYILSHAPGADKSGELRHAGFTHTQQDWQGMKRGSIRTLRKFLGFRLPAGHVAKYVTALEAATSDFNDLAGKTEKGPLVQGAAKKLMAPGFDVIMNSFQQEDKDGTVKFYYRCAGDTSKHLVKSRGYDLKAIEPADPERVWKLIKQEGGGKAEAL